jgi:hypothetical protein
VDRIHQLLDAIRVEQNAGSNEQRENDDPYQPPAIGHAPFDDGRREKFRERRATIGYNSGKPRDARPIALTT